jgi:hypothetical protein
MKIPSD